MSNPSLWYFAGMLARLSIACLFLIAGFLKLMDPATFAWNIYQYGLVPQPLIDPLSVGLPVVEAAAGTGLVFNRRWSYGAVGGLLLLFIVALGYAIINGLNVDCGCFGSGEPGPGGLRKAFLRDVVMLFGLAAVWRLREQRSVQGRTESGNNPISKEDAS